MRIPTKRTIVPGGCTGTGTGTVRCCTMVAAVPLAVYGKPLLVCHIGTCSLSAPARQRCICIPVIPVYMAGSHSWQSHSENYNFHIDHWRPYCILSITQRTPPPISTLLKIPEHARVLQSCRTPPPPLNPVNTSKHACPLPLRLALRQGRRRRRQP